MRYVALLRGINVGGNNIIPMAALRGAFEAAGLSDVTTYIQSGNVVFRAPKTAKAKLTRSIEAMLGEAFRYEAAVILLSGAELARVVEEAPPRFGADPAAYRYDVLFVKEPLRARDAAADVPANPVVDLVTAGAHALYFRRLIAKAASSRLSKLAARPVYKQLTIRNWNTTRKLAALAEAPMK